MKHSFFISLLLFSVSFPVLLQAQAIIPFAKGIADKKEIKLSEVASAIKYILYWNRISWTLLLPETICSCAIIKSCSSLLLKGNLSDRSVERGKDLANIRKVSWE